MVGLRPTIERKKLDDCLVIDDSTFEDDDKASATSSDDKGNASDLDRDQLFRRLKRWFLMDKRHSEDWRR